jgi:uncharacterized metal-binding protein
MPSGSTHDRITLIGLPLVVGGSLLIARNAEYTLITAGSFLFSGMMFGPDLDIYSVQYRRWGFLRWIWLPYRKLLSHRSFFSHGFAIGTIVRVLYLTIFLLLVAIVLVALGQAIWGFPWNWHDFRLNVWRSLRSDYLDWTIATFVGLELGAMSHYVSDWLNSTFKRSKKKVDARKKVDRRDPKIINPKVIKNIPQNRDRNAIKVYRNTR